MGAHQQYAHCSSPILSIGQRQQSRPITALRSPHPLTQVGNVPRHTLPPFFPPVSEHNVNMVRSGGYFDTRMAIPSGE
jgi:hypothetical protein